MSGKPAPVLKTARRSAVRPTIAKSGVVVVGSLNMDLVVRAETMPVPGQTVMGHDLAQHSGGKGANQAMAAGKLSHRAGSRAAPHCRLVGRIGDDPFGKQIRAALEAAHVDASGIIETRRTPSGVALIIVDRHGENCIVVSGGANRRLMPDDLLAQRKFIEISRVLVCQLETPFDTVATAIALAKQSRTLTILDPAPAPAEGLSESLFHVDILLPNQIEAQLLTGVAVKTIDDARRAGEKILARGTRMAIIKMGSQGAVIVRPGGGGGAVTIPIRGFRVPVVDTTAAGDAFAGALAVGLSESMPLEQAVQFANAAGALACTKLGAAASLPTRDEVENLLKPKV